MTMKVLGFLPYADESELKAAPAPFDPDFVRFSLRLHDRLGYHRVLIAQSAKSADSMAIAAFAASETERLGFMIAHRPGFVAPTMAARMLATVYAMSGGRAAVHVITATNDAETQGDGDYLTKDQRYHRSREYVELLRKTWAADKPFDHAGEIYRTTGTAAMVRPAAGSIPVYWGGASGLGIEFGGECADVYAYAGTSVARSQALIDEVRAAAARHGRNPEFLMSIRLVGARTDDEAWARADQIQAQLAAKSGPGPGLGSGSDASARRRVEEAELARGEDDPNLWGGVVVATHGRSHSMALVGSWDSLATQLKRYEKIGVTQAILRGFDNVADVEAIGTELIPRLA